jgi:hypothetical protein
MSLTSYRAAPPRGGGVVLGACWGPRIKAPRVKAPRVKAIGSSPGAWFGAGASPGVVRRAEPGAPGRVGGRVMGGLASLAATCSSAA